MHINDTSVPVVILNFHHGGLGIARSLGRLGVSIYAVHANPDEPTLASRYCTNTVIWDFEKKPVRASLEFLIDLSRQIGGPSILIPTSDSTTLFVSENADTLNEYFFLSSQSPELVKALTDKKEMHFLARRHGVHTPDAYFPNSKEDISKFLENIKYPIMLKGIDGTRLRIQNKPKMVKVHNEKELLEQYNNLGCAKDCDYMLQEYIPGGEDSVWMFNGYFASNSKCLIGITGKKIRQYEPYTGAASLGICLTNEEVDNTTRNFMKAIGYQGILDIGYRFDERDGKYKVLDVNPRIGSSFRLFVGENGMDVAKALYLDLTGQSVPPTTLDVGRKWIVENQDIASGIVYLKDGNLTIKQYLRSLSGIKETAWLAFDDIKPFLKLCNYYIKKFFRLPFNSKLNK